MAVEEKKRESKADEKKTEKEEKKTEREEKKAEETRKSESPKPSVKPDPANPPLTRWNWTPDIVAGILGGLFGLTLALLFGLLGNFINGASPRVFLTLIVFGVAVGYAHICYHMELTGRRYFQQAFSMLTPFTVIYFTIGGIMVFLSEKLMTKMGSLVAPTLPGPIPLKNPLAGPVTAAINVINGPTESELIMWTVIMGGAILLPFFVHSLRERTFRIWWFWPIIVPLFACGLIALLI